MKKYNVWMKDDSNGVVEGICSGLANYLGRDVTILRIAFLAAFFLSGFTAVIVYFILSLFVVPDYNSKEDLSKNPKKKEDIVIKKEEKTNSVIKNL